MRLLFFIIFCVIFKNSQANFIESFYIKVNEEKINLEFTIRAGNLCNGIDIFRTTDTLGEYSLIGVIPGVCGNNNQSVKFEFTDENPVLNRVNYYKINFGGIIYEAKSSILFRKVVFNEIFIYPNPSFNKLNWQIENDENKLIEFKFYDMVGNEIYNLKSTENINQIEVSNWKTGVYYITFYNNQDNLVSNRFVVF